MCCIPPVNVLRIHVCHLEYQGEMRVQPKESETYLILYSNVLYISAVLHIHYLMTCSEYAVSDYHRYLSCNDNMWLTSKKAFLFEDGG